MQIFISGICGFVGSKLAQYLQGHSNVERIVGIDNFSRRGSWTNLSHLESAGIEVLHGDVRCPSDLERAGKVDWIIDAAADPSVLSGTHGGSPSRPLIESNLLGTINLLEMCKQQSAGLILLSTSRVYSMAALSSIPLTVDGSRFTVNLDTTSGEANIPGIGLKGVSEVCSTSSPISLYGSTKLASEVLALEYHHAFDLPVWINRCGVMAGAGQFGKADQGIFAFWLHSWRERRTLQYIGFGGHGYQVRDCLHPNDLAALVSTQMNSPQQKSPHIANVSGGVESARSLAELSAWCEQRWGPCEVKTNTVERKYDLPWVVLDNQQACKHWNWKPSTSTDAILSEIADFADEHPNWIALSQ